ncbi:alanine racemase [Modestobacter sp. I12A-02628]|uniref:Alanine racemase n=1 Tax=Goekera deserti TaxID=2497753 RepID=A0A7K3WIX9_9ACTN|nr:alanine racemase [Goekera deserti]NDI50362.1 alanine racemase [Goekera deserti]NEL55680.1 alanine racemase [Goekera deserti]
MLTPDAAARLGGPELRIDLDAVAANCRLLAERVSGDLMAVVKADGFGHGAATVARTALASGAGWLGVTSLVEALDLRAAGLTAPVLSWLNPVGADFAAAVRAGVDLAVPSPAHLAAVAGGAQRSGWGAARVHLHLDTGLARDGAAPEEWGALCRAARAAEREGTVQVVGVMGHLALADLGGPGANAAGRAAFDRGLQVARSAGLRPAHRHLAATAATLGDPATHHTMVRVGAGLFGIDPSGSTRLRPTLTLTAPVVSVRRVAAGTGVGYGHHWVTPRATTLALVPVGYADGLPRTATDHAEVLLGGRRRPVVGRISMDQVVVDLGPCSPVVAGDVATVVGAGDDGAPTAAEWARWAHTLEHEIVTGLCSAPPRVRRCVSTGSSWGTR